MTLNEIVYSILSAINQENDFALSQRITAEVHAQRALLLRRDNDRNSVFSDLHIQSLGCLEVEPRDIADCCTELSGFKAFRTINTIPKPIRLKNKDGLSYVGTINNSTPFYDIEVAYLPALLSNRFNKVNTYYWIFKDYIWVLNPKNNIIKQITARGLFEVPELAAIYKECDGKQCWTDDSEYPLSLDLAIQLINTVLTGPTLANYRPNANEIKVNGTQAT